MRSFAPFVLLLALSPFGTTQQVYRRAKTPFDAVSLTTAQKAKVESVTAKFNPRLKALRQLETEGADVSDRRDGLNQEYSKALLAVMTPSQKIAYMEAVYRHIEEFLATHPKVKFGDVFVWGGAYAKKPTARASP